MTNILISKDKRILIEARNKLGNDFVPVIDLLKEMISSISLENIKEALRIAGKTNVAEDYLIITEISRDREIAAIKKLNLVYDQLQNGIAIAEQNLAVVKQEIEAEEQQLEVLRLKKQLLMFNGGSQAV